MLRRAQAEGKPKAKAKSIADAKPPHGLQKVGVWYQLLSHATYSRGIPDFSQVSNTRSSVTSKERF